VDFSASGRSQFLVELEASIEQMLRPQVLEEVGTDEQAIAQSPLPEEDISNIVKGEVAEEAPVQVPPAEVNETDEIVLPPQLQQMEQVMQNGMSFLSGMYQMATGKSMAQEDQHISIDKETGEVVMRFKMKW